jgi:hypothetical protein
VDGKACVVVSEEALIKQPELGTMTKKRIRSFFNFYAKVSETTQQDSINLEPEGVKSIPKVLSDVILVLINRV